MRLIDADALIISDEECEGTMCRDCKMQVNGCADFYDIIKNAPTIEERKTGKWLAPMTCSECGGEPWYSSKEKPYTFCPYCGARMEGNK